MSFAIAVLLALILKVTGLVETPLLIAIILCATSLGVLIPVLNDAGEISSTFGQLIVAAGTIADFGAVILLSIFFSGEGSGLDAAADREPRSARGGGLLRGEERGALQPPATGPGPTAGHHRADPRPWCGGAARRVCGDRGLAGRSFRATG